MKTLRKIHTYLALFFSPILILLCLSGAWQVYDLHKGKKPTAERQNSYVPPKIISQISFIHEKQALQNDNGTFRLNNSNLKFFFFLTGIGMALTALIGIAMSFRFAKKKWVPLIVLASGILLPILFLM